MLGQIMIQLVPVTIALAPVFTVLTQLWACNPGGPWWRKRIDDKTFPREIAGQLAHPFRKS